MGLFDEGEVAPHIVGLAAEAGQARSIAVPDELIEPGGLLHIAGGAVTGQRRADRIEILPRVQHIPERFHQLLRLISYTSVKIDQQAVEIVVHLEIISGRLMEQHPAASAKDLDIPLIVDRE